jgi:REP element-mobilizing transposase RayT
LVSRIKSLTAVHLFMMFADLKDHYHNCGFWSRGYYVSSVGVVDENKVRNYVRSQG